MWLKNIKVIFKNNKNLNLNWRTMINMKVIIFQSSIFYFKTLFFFFLSGIYSKLTKFWLFW